MRTYSLFIVASILCGGTSVAVAQQPGVVPAGSETSLRVISPGEVTATPEMWFYEQELRRYEDPKTAVRSNAAFKAQQREARLASMAWYGMSNSRPQANTDPMTGPYSPGWRGNSYQPFNWVNPGTTVVVFPRAARGY